MRYRTLVAAALMATSAAAPAFAQSAQEAQRRLFVCMEQSRTAKVENDRKQEFIRKCVDDAEGAEKTQKDKT